MSGDRRRRSALVAAFVAAFAGASGGPVRGSEFTVQDRRAPERVRPARVDPPATPPPRRGDGPRALPEHLRRAAIGIPALEARLGRDAPDGSGVPVAVVEGSFEGGWMPRTGLAQFRGVRFVSESPDPAPSGHADLVLGELLGRGVQDPAGPRIPGIAPGIDRVHVWESSNWLGEGGLQTGRPVGPRPLPEDVRLVMAAWVADLGAAVPEVLARIDVLAHGAGALVVGGLPNGVVPNGGRPPPVTSAAVNGLPVGTRAAGHGFGLADGRPRPEVVAPAGTTSEAVAMVTGVAARLIDWSNRREAALRARFVAAATPATEQAPVLALVALGRRPEVLRAVLMASAVRENAYTGRWTGDPASSGLDPRVGAGTVHADRALRMLEAGQAGDGSGIGWTAAVPARLPTRGRIRVAEGARELVVAAVWHRVFDGGVDKPVLPRRALGLAAPGETALAAVTESASGVALVRIARPAAGDWTLVLAGDPPAGPEAPDSPIAVAWWTDGPGDRIGFEEDAAAAGGDGGGGGAGGAAGPAGGDEEARRAGDGGG